MKRGLRVTAADRGGGARTTVPHSVTMRHEQARRNVPAANGLDARAQDVCTGADPGPRSVPHRLPDSDVAVSHAP